MIDYTYLIKCFFHFKPTQSFYFNIRISGLINLIQQIPFCNFIKPIYHKINYTKSKSYNKIIFKEVRFSYNQDNDTVYRNLPFEVSTTFIKNCHGDCTDARKMASPPWSRFGPLLSSSLSEFILFFSLIICPFEVDIIFIQFFLFCILSTSY